jgi:hypothetical protein
MRDGAEFTVIYLPKMFLKISYHHATYAYTMRLYGATEFKRSISPSETMMKKDIS